MDLSGILFNPRGRINPAEFWRGLIMLIGASILITVISAYSPLAVASILGIASILLIYPLICVYGKRFHDTGRTAWLVILVFIAYMAISMILTAVLTPVLAPEFAAFQTDLQEKIASGEVGFVEGMELAQAQSSGAPVLVMTIVTTLIASLLTGFIVARLASDPDENEHGMPSGGVAGGTFE
ncbi:MAG: DUF805 domain-containing protein [Hyphomonadaceae bacterium]